MIGAVASAPPAVARTVVRPAATAVNSPDASTGAIPGSSLDHVMARPNTRSPAAFRSAADNDTAPPGGTVRARGTIATEATGPPCTADHVPEAVPQVAVPLSCSRGWPERTAVYWQSPAPVPTSNSTAPCETAPFATGSACVLSSGPAGVWHVPTR